METTQIDNRVDVVAPENILFHYEAAGPFRRLPAYAIDLVIRLAIMALLWVLGLMLVALLDALVGAGEQAIFLLQAVAGVTWFLLQFFYGGLFETFMNGQTPGKRLLGLRVLNTDGEPINALQAIGRHWFLVIDFMPWISLAVIAQVVRDTFDAPFEVAPFMAQVGIIPTFFIGVVVMMFSRRFQRIGDWVCGTMVVVETRHRRFDLVKLQDQRIYELAGRIPANFDVGRSLARSLSLYVDRRRMFSSRRREEMARPLAAPLTELFRLPENTSGDLLLCALYHKTFYADDQSELPPVIAQEASPFYIEE